jgi:hypothetical protein
VAEGFPDESLDFCLVDGRLRDDCAHSVIPKLKQGAVLILDDAHRYLPCTSHAPHARSCNDGPLSDGWTRFLERVADWRCFWTASGKADTAIWIKTQ